MSIFLKERGLYAYEIEHLAARLEGLNRDEIDEILSEDGVVFIRRPCEVKSSAWYRGVRLALYPLVFLTLVALTGVKYVVTGDAFLDSWAKRSKLIGAMCSLIEGK